jgi:hypothetical protein
MLGMGDGDRAGALAEFQLALAEARRIDPGGAREAEVLNYLALFHGQGGDSEEAARCSAAAAAIFKKFEETP